MRIVALSTIKAFVAANPAADQPLRAWYTAGSEAAWASPAEVKAQFRNASILKSRRVVFNIKGNDYRLIVSVAYKVQVVYIKFIGTHFEYYEINADTVELP